MILDSRKWRLRMGTGSNLLRIFFSNCNSVFDSDIDIADGDDLGLDYDFAITGWHSGSEIAGMFWYSVGNTGNIETKAVNPMFFASINERVLFRNQYIRLETK